MLNNTEREEITNWINSGMNYDQGLFLLSKHTKNRILLKKRNLPLAKIEFELKKLVGSNTQILVSNKKKPTINQTAPAQIQTAPVKIESKKKRMFKNLMKSLYHRSFKFRNSLKELIQFIMICIALGLLMILTLFEKEKKY